MVTHWMRIAILTTTVLTISGQVPGIAQSSQPQSDTYTWNAELVSHQPSTEDDAVVSVRPYGASTTTE